MLHISFHAEKGYMHTLYTGGRTNSVEMLQKFYSNCDNTNSKKADVWIMTFERKTLRIIIYVFMFDA